MKKKAKKRAGGSSTVKLHPKRGEKCEVRLVFDTSKMGTVEGRKLRKAQSLLSEIGVNFDSGGSFDFQEWELDWSLSGPVQVQFIRFKGNKK